MPSGISPSCRYYQAFLPFAAAKGNHAGSLHSCWLSVHCSFLCPSSRFALIIARIAESMLLHDALAHMRWLFLATGQVIYTHQFKLALRSSPSQNTSPVHFGCVFHTSVEVLTFISGVVFGGAVQCSSRSSRLECSSEHLGWCALDTKLTDKSLVPHTSAEVIGGLKSLSISSSTKYKEET
jgi:hypothetical protein